MAKEISRKFSVNLSGVVENSISAVKAIRRAEQSRKEAEFQRAIANGLSYEEQVIMREEQLKAEKESSFGDTEYVASLEKSVADTKKLNRFNKYRTRYAESLGELSSGKINEEQYLSILKSQLDRIDDPDLRLEIQTDVTAAESKLKTYNDTILSNQVKKAKYDGTKAALSEVVARVNTARAKALISDQQDEVTAYDETLSALNSQLSSVRIQDSITDFQVKSATRGTNPIEKLNYINSEIQKADPNTAIRIGDRTYTSAQQFWSLERDGFLAGSSQIFGNFFNELNNHVKDTVDSAVAKFGYPTQNILDDALQSFNELRAKPEFAPFINKLDVTQSAVMSGAVDSFTKKVIDAAETSLQFEFADTQIKVAGQKYGIDTSAKRSELFQRVRGLEQSQLIPSGSAERLATKLEVDIPEITREDGIIPVAPKELTPAKPTTSAPVLAPVTTPASASTPLSVQTQSSVQPPQSTPVTGVGTKSTDGKFTFTAGGWKPTASIPVSTPAATPVPVTPTTPPTYTGASIVDYLKSQNQDSSFESRKKLAIEKGIIDYKGEPKQNDELLKLLRG